MAYASRTYTPSSSTTTFALTTSGGDPIGYIQESDISVKVGGVTYTNAASGVNTYQITGTSTVEQPSGGNVVLNSGTTAAVVLQRTTAIQDATVVYTAGSTLTSTDLNNADNQIRFGLQEFSDDYAALFTGTGDLTGLGAFIGGSDTWVSNNAKAATTAAIDGQIDAKATAKVKDDIIATAPVSIADDSPSAGKITISVDAELTELATMSTGTAQALADLTGTEVQILDGATVTTDQLNRVDATSSIQTQIDGKQASDADLTAIAALAKADGNIIVGDGSTWVAENGATARTSLGAQAAAADLTTLSSMQSGAATELASLTSTELDILDGAVVTTTELNYLDNVSSNVQTQLDGKQASGSYQPLDADLTTLAGMQGATASILAGGTSLTSTLTELNQLDGKTLGETSLTTNSNTAIPTSKAVADHVSGAVTAVGGFVAIANDASFPATASMPASGVVVSITDADDVAINGSGVSTTGRTTDGTPATVTINGFPATMYGETLAAGVGLQVLSTGSSNTYTYHKLLAAESDVKQLSDDINDFNERYRTDATGNNPSSDNHAGDLFYNQGSDKMYVRNAANNAWGEVTSTGDFKYLFLCPAGGSGAPSFPGAVYDLRETSNTGTGASVTSAAQLIVSVNGVIQKANPGTNPAGLDGFVMSDTNEITFCANVTATDDIFIVQVGSAVTLNAPANNTVSTDVLQNLAVATGKIADDAVTVDKLANSINTEIAANTAKVTNATHTGEVTGATALTIANDVVDEANLKVDNSPTNDYVLTAKSSAAGGLTWKAVTIPTLDAPVITGGTEIAPSGTLNQTISNYSDDCSYTITPTNCNAGSVNASGVFVITHTSGTPSYTIKATTASLGLDDSIVVTKNLTLKLATPGLSSPADSAPNTNVAYTVTSNDANDNKLVVDFGSSNFTIQSVSVGSSSKVGNTAELTGFTTNNPVLTVQFTAAATYNVTATAKDTTGTHPDSVPSAADTIVIAQPYNMDYLVIAGGGGGGDGNSGGGGGGGAGGYRNSYNSEPSGGGASSETALSVTPGTVYTITVGNYGEGRNGNWDGLNGGNSSIVGSDITDVVSIGGGGGGGHSEPVKNGDAGGSGGGAGKSVDGPCQVGVKGAGSGGAGTAGQGYAGSDGNCTNWAAGCCGGGGGASEAGGTDGAGFGGDGLSSSITGSAVTRAGGGGGSSDPNTTQDGGTGGGGNGYNGTGAAATANTGSGGGGGGSGGGHGGTGIVILRMATSDYSGTQSGGTVTTSGSDTIISYTTVSSSHTYTA